MIKTPRSGLEEWSCLGAQKQTHLGVGGFVKAQPGPWAGGEERRLPRRRWLCVPLRACKASPGCDRSPHLCSELSACIVTEVPFPRVRHTQRNRARSPCVHDHRPGQNIPWDLGPVPAALIMAQPGWPGPTSWAGQGGPQYLWAAEPPTACSSLREDRGLE